ncbi:unnamed protein product [Closterium sp. Yama58-4]|nr:unnamed protein product [Closterium sp. Yama58-4]
MHPQCWMDTHSDLHLYFPSSRFPHLPPAIQEEEEPGSRLGNREADGDAPAVLEGPAAAAVKEEGESWGGGWGCTRIAGRTRSSNCEGGGEERGGKGAAAGGTGGAGVAGGGAGGGGGGGAVAGEGKKRPLPEASGRPPPARPPVKPKVEASLKAEPASTPSRPTVPADKKEDLIHGSSPSSRGLTPGEAAAGEKGSEKGSGSGLSRKASPYR